MAKTLIGQLILRLQQNVSVEAGKVTKSLRGIEQAAANLDNKRPTWGNKFDQQLRQLKVTPQEHAAIVESWGRLLSSIDGKAAGQQKGVWRSGVLSHLATMRTEIDLTNTRAKVLGNTLRSIASGAGFLIGGSAAYAGYGAVRGGVNAAFEQQRVEAQGHFSGLSEDDQGALKAKAEELAAKYGLAVTNVLQALQEASLSMPSTDDALASADSIARLLTSLESIYGPDGAVSGTYSILRGLDNVAMNQTPEEVLKALDAFMKAQQVLGKDFSPDAFRQMLQYARIAGKSLDDDFLLTWMPILASETAGADAGTRLRANFDQLIVGRASKEAESAQAKYGIRTDETGLIGQEAYAANPVLWAHDYLLPALKEAGVNTDDPVALATVLGEITNNRQSSDFLSASLISFEQYLRTATERIPAASGLAAADEVREIDPFSAVQGMVNSLSNLSGALGEHVAPVIIPMFSAISGAIEGLATKVREAEGWEVGVAALGVALGGLGALGAGKVGLAWITAGPSLQTAAGMLQSAATSLGGGPAPGGGPNGKKTSPGEPMNAIWGVIGGVASGLAQSWVAGQVVDSTMGPMTPEQQAVKDGAAQRVWERLMSVISTPQSSAPVTSPYDNLRSGGVSWGLDPDATTAAPSVDTTQVAAAGVEADTTATKLMALNTTLRPMVDTTPIGRLVALLERAIALQNQLGAAPTNVDLDARVRASFADYGVTP